MQGIGIINFLTRFIIILEISNFSDINRRTFIRENWRGKQHRKFIYHTGNDNRSIDRDNNNNKIVTCYALFRAKKQ